MQRSKGRRQRGPRHFARRWAVLVGACAAAACHVPQASAAAPNVFVTTSAGVQEYTLAGVPVGAPHFLPAAPGGDGGPRDLVVDAAGRLHVFNGTFDPFLSTRPAG